MPYVMSLALMTAPSESLAMWVALGRGIDTSMAEISCLVLEEKGSREQPVMATPAALWIAGSSAVVAYSSSLHRNVFCFSAFEPGTTASDGKSGAISMEGTISECVRLFGRSIFTWIDSKSERFCSGACKGVSYCVGSGAHEAC